MKANFMLITGLLLLFSSAGYTQTCSNRVTLTNPDSRFEFFGDGLSSSDRRFEISDDEVADLHTGLIWQRCSMGQSWDGTTCSGSATEHNWQDALALATGDWRLPNVKELSSILEIACITPAINLTVFPATVSNLYWSSSSSLFSLGEYGVNDHWALAADFSSGWSSADVRYSTHYVRLIRGGQ